jgi:hypothetical protein
MRLRGIVRIIGTLTLGAGLVLEHLSAIKWKNLYNKAQHNAKDWQEASEKWEEAEKRWERSANYCMTEWKLTIAKLEKVAHAQN